MENTPDTIVVNEPQQNRLFLVTSTSKILSAVLFIILPFIGFWIGLQFSTETPQPITQIVPIPDAGSRKSELPEKNVQSESKPEQARDVVMETMTDGFAVIDGAVVYQTRYAPVQKISTLDVATFQAMNIRTENDLFELLYAKDIDTVIVADHLGTILEITDADPATFTILGENFARDNKTVFTIVETGGGMMYKPRILKIDGADPATFVVLDSGYAKDKNRVYFSAWKAAIEVVDADPVTFAITDIKSDVDANSYKAKDKNHFYDFGKIAAE